MEQQKRRKKYIGTPVQKALLNLVFASAIIPTAIVAFCLYRLIFNLFAQQMVVQKIVEHSLIPVVQIVDLVILAAIPIILFIIWIIALQLSNRIAGPLYRLEKELDARISGEKSGPIKVREKDVLKSLADKINILLNK